MRILLKARLSTARILDIGQQQGSAAVKLEIQVAFPRHRLDKQFRTRIEMGAILILGALGNDIVIRDPKHHGNRLAIMHHTRCCLRFMLVFQGPEVFNRNRIGRFPCPTRPLRLYSGQGVHPLNRVTHRINFPSILYSFANPY